MSSIRTAALFIALACAALAPVGCKAFSPYPTSFEAPTADEEAPRSTEPPQAETLYYMGRVLAAQGKHAHAEAVFANTLQRFPRYLPTYVDLAEMKVRQRRYDHAAEILRRGLSVEPGSPVLHNNLGMCLLLEKNYSDARDSFAEAVQADPDEARYAANLALASGLLGRDEEALALWTRIVGPEAAKKNLAVVTQQRSAGAGVAPTVAVAP